MPWGLALVSALEKKASYWDHKANLLVRRARPGDILPRPPKGGGKTREQRQPIRLKEAPTVDAPLGSAPPPMALEDRPTHAKTSVPRTWTTTYYDRHNSLICKRYNDSRGCSSNCPQGYKHVCDLVLKSSGVACGASSHNRLGHNERDHGDVKRSAGGGAGGKGKKRR